MVAVHLPGSTGISSKTKDGWNMESSWRKSSSKSLSESLHGLDEKRADMPAMSDESREERPPHKVFTPDVYINPSPPSLWLFFSTSPQGGPRD